eukprot:scaffold176853_cov43-Tisochrysis_lutea.AAC.3
MSTKTTQRATRPPLLASRSKNALAATPRGPPPSRVSRGGVMVHPAAPISRSRMCPSSRMSWCD